MCSIFPRLRLGKILVHTRVYPYCPLTLVIRYIYYQYAIDICNILYALVYGNCSGEPGDDTKHKSLNYEVVHHAGYIYIYIYVYINMKPVSVCNILPMTKGVHEVILTQLLHGGTISVNWRYTPFFLKNTL